MVFEEPPAAPIPNLEEEEPFDETNSADGEN
jgi:hypothetical protein